MLCSWFQGVLCDTLRLYGATLLGYTNLPISLSNYLFLFVLFYYLQRGLGMFFERLQANVKKKDLDKEVIIVATHAQF